MTLLDILPSDQKEIIDQIDTEDQIKKLQEYFLLLTPREQEILIYRYGLNKHKVYTQKRNCEHNAYFTFICITFRKKSTHQTFESLS